MKYREIAVTDAVLRSKGFLGDNETVLALADSADFVRARQKVDQVLEELRNFAFEQDAGLRGFKGETAKQRQLRIDLRKEWLKPIAVIARRNLSKVPEYTSLQMPKASLKENGFIASARGMATVAASHREALISYGIPDTFVDDLNKAVDDFEASIRARDFQRGRRAAATKGLESAAQEGRIVLNVLDARMRHWAKGDATLLAAWKGARHIRQKPGPVSSRAASAPSTTNEAASPADLPVASA